MKCELCGKDHDGLFGSGRFCCLSCSRSFSTYSKRLEINKKVSKKLRGKPSNRKRSDSIRLARIGNKAYKNKIKNMYETLPYDELPLSMKRRRVLEEQEGKCAICGIKK